MIMEKEIWKDIKDYEEMYQISDLGRVKSLARIIKHQNRHYRKDKILKTSIDNHGYLQVTLCKNGKVKRFHVHRLVAQAFIPNPENKPQVNHIDGNKLNNNINNLEWNTAGENTYHAYKNDLIKHYNRKINQYDLDGNFIKTWDSAKDIEIKINIHKSAICNCCKNKRKTAGGYIWKYVD